MAGVFLQKKDKTNQRELLFQMHLLGSCVERELDLELRETYVELKSQKQNWTQFNSSEL